MRVLVIGGTVFLGRATSKQRWRGELRVAGLDAERERELLLELRE